MKFVIIAVICLAICAVSTRANPQEGMGPNGRSHGGLPGQHHGGPPGQHRGHHRRHGDHGSDTSSGSSEEFRNERPGCGRDPIAISSASTSSPAALATAQSAATTSSPAVTAPPVASTVSP